MTQFEAFENREYLNFACRTSALTLTRQLIEPYSLVARLDTTVGKQTQI